MSGFPLLFRTRGSFPVRCFPWKRGSGEKPQRRCGASWCPAPRRCVSQHRASRWCTSWHRAPRCCRSQHSTRGYRSHWCCASWCCASWCCASWCCVPWCCVSWCCVPWCCVSQRCCCVSRCCASQRCASWCCVSQLCVSWCCASQHVFSQDFPSSCCRSQRPLRPAPNPPLFRAKTSGDGVPASCDAVAGLGGSAPPGGTHGTPGLGFPALGIASAHVQPG
uniref:Uncharacterized protein n=1 Tax=Anser brachyrhynchus TaxID=132585 RepID=A0A8B9C184_9AVES